MPIPDFAHGIQISFLDTADRARIKGHGATGSTTGDASAAAPGSAAGGSADGTQTASGSMPLSFDDFVDIVNPLQHLPIISTLYQHYANDPINTFPKIAGDMLYGGPIGLLASVADTVFQKATGKSFGETAFDWVMGDKPPAPGTALASTTNAGTTAAASTAASAAAPVAPAAAAATHLASAKPSPFLAHPATPHMAASRSAPTPPTMSRMPASRPAMSSAPAKATASSAPQSLAASSASQLPNMDPASFNALSAFLHDKGIDDDTSQRTLDAYRRTMELGTELPPGAQQLH